MSFCSKYGQELKSEFFIPIVADQFIKEGGKIEVIPTTSSWFGVTYKEDAPVVEKSLNDLIEKGEYPERLWSLIESLLINKKAIPLMRMAFFYIEIYLINLLLP